MDEKLLVFIEQIGSQDALTDSAPVSAHREQALACHRASRPWRHFMAVCEL